MTDPLVCCVCLANGRPAMLRRAVASFAAQTYPNRVLLIWDNATPVMSAEEAKALFKMDPRVFIKHGDKRSIGAMRNDAAKWLFTGAQPYPDIIAHWDSDDLSHSNRLSEQVALLQSSCADVVGYHQMLFWDERDCSNCGPAGLVIVNGRPVACPKCRGTQLVNEAWLYTGRPPQVLGTSLCYWARAWKQKPFRDQNIGEDLMWVSGLKMRTASSFVDAEPRLIASIHGGNSSTFLNPSLREWTRVAQWDEFCREAMRLELHK